MGNNKLDLPKLLRFGFVGATSGLLYMLLPLVFVEGLAMHVAVASALTVLVVIAYNYMLHYHWTFSTDAPHGRVFVKYLFMGGTALVIIGVIMYVGTEILEVHYMLAHTAAALVTVCWSLTLSSLWVFRHRPESD